MYIKVLFRLCLEVKDKNFHMYKYSFHPIYIYTHIYIYIYIYQRSILMGRVFTNGSGDQGLIPGRVIPNNKKMVLDASLFNTRNYKVLIMSKWSNPGK